MFRVSHHTFLPPRVHIPRTSAQTGTPAGKRATKTSYKCPKYLKLKTSSTAPLPRTLSDKRTFARELPQSTRIEEIFIRVIPVIRGQNNYPLPTRATICLNSAKGFSSFTFKML